MGLISLISLMGPVGHINKKSREILGILRFRMGYHMTKMN